LKIIHFSDTHLGFSDLDVTNANGVNQREADFYEAFKDVIEAIILQMPDYVIHTGDLFHRASPSNRAITFVLTQLKRLEKLHIPLIISSQEITQHLVLLPLPLFWLVPPVLWWNT